MFGKDKISMLGAEFLGTALLTTAVLVLLRTTAISFFIAATAGLTLGLVVMWFSKISGAHINPAVTLGLWTARQIETTKAVAYIAVQVGGALCASLLYQYLSNTTLHTKSGTFDARIWVAELVGAFILAIGVTAALTRGFDTLLSAVSNGAALFLGIMIATVASAGIINPAVAVGLRSWGTAYVLGPLVGGVLGVNLYMSLFAPSSSKVSNLKAKIPTVKVKSGKTKRKLASR